MNWILGAKMKGKQKCCCMLYIARFRYDMASSILLLIAEMRHEALLNVHHSTKLRLRYIHTSSVGFYCLYQIITEMYKIIYSILAWLHHIILLLVQGLGLIVTRLKILIVDVFGFLHLNI